MKKNREEPCLSVSALGNDDSLNCHSKYYSPTPYKINSGNETKNS